VALDVVGYSRLMERDESGTLTMLTEHRTERLEPALARHGGRLIKLIGDGALVEFASVVDALNAAIEFQRAMTRANLDRRDDERISFRIGVHVGDVIIDGDDLYGDGMNVAARLEGQAPPGGILISGNARPPNFAILEGSRSRTSSGRCRLFRSCSTMKSAKAPMPSE
jgi:adenylate cyclase